MEPFYEDSDRGLSICCGNCLFVLPDLASDSVDSVVTDPPYELGFMGKSWDRSGIAYNIEVWKECLRVLKPGGHLLAFGGSRTYHRLACAVEDAGFEIRDQIQWVYGSGFPKSLDVSKAIDAAAGAEREAVGERIRLGDKVAYPHNASSNIYGRDNDHLRGGMRPPITSPATDAARQWNGWGTALKPAQEILTVAYKPRSHGAERDKIDANLSLLEARLWSLLPVRIAAEHFQLSQVEQGAVLASAQWSADERSSTQAVLLGQMDTSRCASVMSTCLNTVRSWKSTLDGLCEVASTSTIETRLSLTTDLRILNCSLSQTTPSTIIEAAFQADGRALNALPVAQHFAAARLKLSGILTLFAHDAATCGAPTLHRGGVETNGIVLARKPLVGTVAQNIIEHGTGGLNIDACRIETSQTDQDYINDRIGGFNRTQSIGGNGKYQGGETMDRTAYDATKGRWPANIILDGSDEVLAGFPDSVSTGGGGSRDAGADTRNGIYGKYGARDLPKNVGIGDSGSAARFFYCAKASQEDREEGLDGTRIVKYNTGLCRAENTELVGLLARATSESTARWLIGESGENIMGQCPWDSLSITLTTIRQITTSQILNLLTPSLINGFIRAANCETGNGGNRAESAENLSPSMPTTTSASPEASVRGVNHAVSKMLLAISDAANWKPLNNFHSTVKPTDLMRYLVRLVTPYGGTVLDPFCGSGSTGKAAALEHFNFIGIELNEEYCELAKRRIMAATQQGSLFR